MRSRIADKREILEGIWRKTKRQTLKDYVAFPLLAGPFAPWVFAGNMTANLIRNVWSYVIIFCGHFPDDVQEFSIEETEGRDPRAVVLPPDPRLGEPDRRQALSHPERQPVVPDRAPPVPRHPGAPARRDRPEVQEICERYGIPYNNGLAAQAVRDRGAQDRQAGAAEPLTAQRETDIPAGCGRAALLEFRSAALASGNSGTRTRSRSPLLVRLDRRAAASTRLAGPAVDPQVAAGPGVAGGGPVDRETG